MQSQPSVVLIFVHDQSTVYAQKWQSRPHVSPEPPVFTLALKMKSSPGSHWYPHAGGRGGSDGGGGGSAGGSGEAIVPSGGGEGFGGGGEGVGGGFGGGGGTVDTHTV